jgi:hypothetical protein
VVSGQALIIASVEPRGGHPDARPDGLATSL